MKTLSSPKPQIALWESNIVSNKVDPDLKKELGRDRMSQGVWRDRVGDRERVIQREREKEIKRMREGKKERQSVTEGGRERVRDR